MHKGVRWSSSRAISPSRSIAKIPARASTSTDPHPLLHATALRSRCAADRVARRAARLVPSVRAMVVRDVTERTRMTGIAGARPAISRGAPEVSQSTPVLHAADDATVERGREGPAIAGELHTRRDRPKLVADASGEVRIGVGRTRYLGELAANPSNAKDAWKKLNTTERAKVVELMEKRYGAVFVSQFKQALASNYKSTLFTYDAGLGPSEATLRARGFMPKDRGPYNEIWVHPNGDMVQKVLDTGPAKGVKAP